MKIRSFSVVECGMHMVDGLRSATNAETAVGMWGTDHFFSDLIADLAKATPLAKKLFDDESFNNPNGIPGVYLLEVCAGLGEWYIEYVFCHNGAALPSFDEVEAELRRLDALFWRHTGTPPGPPLSREERLEKALCRYMDAVTNAPNGRIDDESVRQLHFAASVALGLNATNSCAIGKTLEEK